MFFFFLRLCYCLCFLLLLLLVPTNLPRIARCLADLVDLAPVEYPEQYS